MGRYILVVHSDATESQEDEFNEWYDGHVSKLSELEGFRSAQRFRLIDAPPPLREALRYLAIYELETDHVEDIPKILDEAKAAGKIRINESFNGATDTFGFYIPIFDTTAASA